MCINCLYFYFVKKKTFFCIKISLFFKKITNRCANSFVLFTPKKYTPYFVPLPFTPKSLFPKGHGKRPDPIKNPIKKLTSYPYTPKRLVPRKDLYPVVPRIFYRLSVSFLQSFFRIFLSFRDTRKVSLYPYTPYLFGVPDTYPEGVRGTGFPPYEKIREKSRIFSGYEKSLPVPLTSPG